MNRSLNAKKLFLQNTTKHNKAHLGRVSARAVESRVMSAEPGAVLVCSWTLGSTGVRGGGDKAGFGHAGPSRLRRAGWGERLPRGQREAAPGRARRVPGHSLVIVLLPF